MSRPLHPDAEAIIAKLKQEQIKALYHFTDVENLPRIFEAEALCSKLALEERNSFPPPKPGGDDLSHSLDRRRGNWDKVSLSLTPYTPMRHKKSLVQHLCFIGIDLSVAGWSGVVFTDANATKTGHQRSSGLAGLNFINFDYIQGIARPGNPDWHRSVQAEILVPDRIPLNAFLGVAFVSEASMQYAHYLVRDTHKIGFAIREHLFYYWAKHVAFSHLKTLTLTDKMVSGENIEGYFEDISLFGRSNTKQITLIATVEALQGTKAEVRWQPIDKSESTEFDSIAEWIHYPSISIDELPNGHCLVEYYINGLKWGVHTFEVVS